ncbi:recombinase family protein [Hyphomicrobium sp. LHD-15]|uniref:recombinase family protein n=1 Tax=Hyphomicrobium sp. LHD-15 TaxID=3072142 RepID=UPI00280EC1B3|nr:recombinase family protein [Hyphomicrobium sp. LHD-15]MDQ8699232.1 recombinase family protein [Hyphomicrobium sp. LHD-15]
MSKIDRASTHLAVPCAIYTRKSSEEGLEQEFNSLDAQREACEAYALSQKHAGWSVLPEMYDDGGLSGGTMERPALQRLLDEVRAGRVKVIVVYKVDRLTRSLADFAKIVEVLDAYGASFVSVTQHFNTTTSMGRLTLNVLLSFAQFEREIAGERIRDKIAASKKKGMWMGGNVPLGYDVRDRKLIVNPAEADTVRHIFQRYAEIGSVSALKLELDRDGIVSKQRRDASGRCAGGSAFTRGALYLLLQNRIYRGEIVHKGDVFAGEHEALVENGLWNAVAAQLNRHRHDRRIGAGSDEPSLLAGLLFDGKGQRLMASHAVKSGKRYRYYVSQALVVGARAKSPDGMRLPAGDIEALALDRLRQFFATPAKVSDAVSEFNLSAATQRVLLSKANELAKRWGERSYAEQRGLLMRIAEAVIVHDDGVELRLKCDRIATELGAELGQQSGQQNEGKSRLKLCFEAQLKRVGNGSRLIVGAGTTTNRDDRLVRLIAQAFEFRDQLFSGRYDSVEDMAAELGTSGTYVTTLVRLAFLSPNIVRAILDGRQPPDLTLTRLMTVSKELPLAWSAQGQYLGFADF